MVAVLLGLAASAAFSCADFFGGMASRRANPWLVVLANQAIGLVPLTVYLLLLTDHGPDGRDIALSMVAGVAAVAGLGLLFGGFAVGRMAVVAPVSVLAQDAGGFRAAVDQELLAAGRLGVLVDRRRCLPQRVQGT